MKPWKQIGETEILYDGWRKVFRKKYLMNNGKEFVAEISDKEGMNAVAVIALTPENKVIVARQFRVGPGKIMDELPGGVVEPNEDHLDAVTRELQEETGYKAGTISKIGAVYKNGYVHTKWHFYFADNCVLSGEKQQLDEWEEIDVELISIDQLFDNARTCNMSDTEALFFAYKKLSARRDS